MGYDARNEMWAVIAMGFAGLEKSTCVLDFERAEDGSVIGTFAFDAAKEWEAARLIMHLLDSTHGPVTASKGRGRYAEYQVSFSYPAGMEDPIKKAEAGK
ncbi:hypothetical protein [Streptomyces sp. NPDC057580]|uniref:hypothetical protein n=1 Tax=Streptomyces sp. NPDC057580 TaxID=3346173 RepID=UPI0036B926B1